MPKFRINCSTTVSYTLLVEAPTKEAAELFYDTCDGGEFHRAQENTDWNLDDVYVERSEQPPDITVDAEGEIVSRHSDTPVEGP